MKVTRILRRETDCLERGVPLCIEVHPRELVLWVKGERKKHNLSYSILYREAAKRDEELAKRRRP